jgi:hypothetical protein
VSDKPLLPDVFNQSEPLRVHFAEDDFIELKANWRTVDGGLLGLVSDGRADYKAFVSWTTVTYVRQ